MLRGSNSCVASNTFVAGLTNARRLGSVIAYMELAYGIQFFEPLDLAHPSVSGGLLVPMSVRLTPLLCLSFVLVPGLPIKSMTLSWLMFVCWSSVLCKAGLPTDQLNMIETASWSFVMSLDPQLNLWNRSCTRLKSGCLVLIMLIVRLSLSPPCS